MGPKIFSISPQPLTNCATMRSKIGTSGDVNTIVGQILKITQFKQIFSPKMPQNFNAVTRTGVWINNYENCIVAHSIAGI